jgi:hypothetical protein
MCTVGVLYRAVEQYRRQMGKVVSLGLRTKGGVQIGDGVPKVKLEIAKAKCIASGGVGRCAE